MEELRCETQGADASGVRKKHFITVVSHQIKGWLALMEYLPEQSDVPCSPLPVHFPMAAVIGSVVEVGEPFRLTAVCSVGDDEEKNGNTRRNFKTLLEDIERHLGCLDCMETDVVETPYDSNEDDLSSLTDAVCSTVRDGEDVYACITFGEKTDTLALYLALMRIGTGQHGSSARIAGCFYGQKTAWGEGGQGQREAAPTPGKLKDVASFLFRGIGSGDVPALPPRDGAGGFHFITGLSLAGPGSFHLSNIYDASGQVKLGDLRYPICLYLREALRDGGDARLTYVYSEGNENADRNTLILLREAASAIGSEAALWSDGRLMRASSLPVPSGGELHIGRITCPSALARESLEALSEDIVRSVGPADKLVLDITFGEKGMTIAYQQAVAEALAAGSWELEIAAVFYSLFYSKEKRSKLKDVSRFAVANAVELLMRQQGESDPDLVRRAVLGEGGLR